MKLPLFMAVVLLAGCATKPKQYQAPDMSKVRESHARLSKTVSEAHQSAKKAQAGTIAARDQANAATLTLATAIANLKTLKDAVPPALKESVALIAKEVDDIAVNQRELVQHLDEVSREQETLESKLTQADAEKLEVGKNLDAYWNEAVKLADTATGERNARIEAEKKLHWYRMRWWGSWIALGLGVIACLVVAVLKFTGRLALAGAKL